MFKPAYCDYITHVIKHAIPQATEIPLKVGEIRMDLDQNGSYRSAKRVITVKDHNDKSYTITVEESE
jgi:hypothetical protein